MNSTGTLALPLEPQTGPVQAYKIVLPYLPPSKNVFDGWPPAWKSGAKKKWVRDVASWAEELQIPVGQTRVGLAARLVFPTRTRRDPQNYAQCLWHWVPDALVQCRVLVDDQEGAIEIGPNWGITMMVDTRTQIPKKKRQRTVVTVAVQGGGR